MKLFKKIICITVITLIALMLYATSIKAATTLKVTADTLNLREKASTSSDILTLLSNGDICELIEEEGDWYKVKFESYTGYVSKEYVKKETASQDTSGETSNDTNGNSSIAENENDASADVQITAKISKKTSLKLVPLIYSSEIDTLNNNEEIVILSEVNGWAFIQTDTMTGWVRSDSIKDKKTISDNSTSNSENDDKTESDSKTNNEIGNAESENKNTESSNTESTEKTDNANKVENTDKTESADNTTDESYEKKTMYINDSYVNVRKEPNTSSDVIMTLALNTKLTVIGESGDWYKVTTSEGDAYVSKELLSSKQVSSSRGSIKKTSSTSESIADSTTTTSKTSEDANAEETKKTSSKTNTSSSSKKQEIVTYAKQFLGVPYVYGGASKSGFDCSGFTMYVYQKFGVSMPHGAQSQARLGKEVNADKSSASSLKNNLQAGDLVFFLDYETMDEIGHVGIYIGDGEFIHASSGSGYCVKISNLLPGEAYNKRYCGSRRII